MAWWKGKGKPTAEEYAEFLHDLGRPVEVEDAPTITFCALPDVDALMLSLKAQEDCLRLVREVCGLPLDPLA